MLGQYEIIIKAVIALTLVCAGFGGGYKFRDLTAQVDISSLEKTIADNETKAANEKTKAANEALKRNQELAEHFAEIDKSKTEELRNEKQRFEKAMACIRNNSGCGLRIPTIPAGMPENTSPGMDDGKTDTGQNGQAIERIVTVGHECDQAIYQLSGLQEIITEFNNSLNKNSMFDR